MYSHRTIRKQEKLQLLHSSWRQLTNTIIIITFMKKTRAKVVFFRIFFERDTRKVLI